MNPADDLERRALAAAAEVRAQEQARLEQQRQEAERRNADMISRLKTEAADGWKKPSAIPPTLATGNTGRNTFHRSDGRRTVTAKTMSKPECSGWTFGCSRRIGRPPVVGKSASTGSSPWPVSAKCWSANGKRNRVG